MKLYAVLCNHTQVPSLAAVIPKLHATHSFHAPLLNVNVGAVLSPVYCSVSTKLVLQLFIASHEIALNVVVAPNDWLLHIVDHDVGTLPFVVYLTCVHHAHGTQLIVLVLPLNRYHAGVHVGAHVGTTVFIHVHVAIKFTVLLSLSLIWTVQLSLHV